MSDSIKRISDPADPRRCQAITANGQCQAITTVPGGLYCHTHGGASEKNKLERENQSRYRLSKFQAQYQSHLSQPDVKSLRDEIAILRMMLEERLNACSGPSDLVIASGPISDLVAKIERVVVSCHKLELSADALMDKSRLLQIADQVVKAVSAYLPPDKLSQASSDILSAFTQLGAASVDPRHAAPLPSGVLDISDDDDLDQE